MTTTKKIEELEERIDELEQQLYIRDREGNIIGEAYAICVWTGDYIDQSAYDNYWDGILHPDADDAFDFTIDDVRKLVRRYKTTERHLIPELDPYPIDIEASLAAGKILVMDDNGDHWNEEEYRKTVKELEDSTDTVASLWNELENLKKQKEELEE